MFLLSMHDAILGYRRRRQPDPPWIDRVSFENTQLGHLQEVAGLPALERVRRDLVLTSQLAAAAEGPVKHLKAQVALEHHVAALLAHMQSVGMGKLGCHIS